MGRPRKSEPRSKQLNLSLTETELESVRRRAVALGLRPVHFGRLLLLGASHTQSRKPDPESVVERLIHTQLVRLGNNLNQMVRHFHRTGDPKPPADLEPLLTDIRYIIAHRYRHDR